MNATETAVWACQCGIPYRGDNAQDAAEACCTCRADDCTQPRSNPYVYCDEHETAARAARKAEQHAKYRALPACNDSINITNVECWLIDDRYTFDLDGTVDDLLYDDSVDLADIEAHPCRGGTLEVPDIASYVNEQWGEHFEEWDGLPTAAAQVLDDAYQRLTKLAPTCYTPILAHRFDLAQYDEQRQKS